MSILTTWRNQGYHLNYGEHVLKRFLSRAVVGTKHPQLALLDIGCGEGRDLTMAKGLCERNGKSCTLYGVVKGNAL
ncbi:MAG: hypothetical protein EOP04_17115 [Proteobacteria bacterium]|nr:MAG: hypothetical protein EOP04_17115 [Pseudomonadota bacterium]